jgi:4-amino-4-deoxy-L-arabinose transferase
MNTLNPIFPLANSWLLILSFLLAVASVVLSDKGKNNYAVFILFFAAFFLRLFMAWLDPFLHPWDECFHALVARNMMGHPFKPMLIANPIVDYTIDNWCSNHIWLHKQPLFLWQMALSMKLFGVSPFAIRYPAVLMGALMVPMLYRIVIIATGNTRIAFMSAILMCFSYYHLELLAGYYGIDQNDIAFDFYVLASIWAYMEYTRNRKMSWAILIGVLAGCAVLNKWLTGMLIFGGWGLHILLAIRQKEIRKDILHFLLSILVCTAVFLPWQLYILHAFPAEAKYEFAFNSRHVWEVVESHGGTIWYYFDFFNVYFGKYIWCLLPIGLLLSPFIKQYRNHRMLTLAVYFMVVYTFFSFVAKTKVQAYLMVVVPIGYMFMAVAIYYILDKVRIQKYAFISVTIIIALVIFDLPDITEEHDPNNNKLNNVAVQTYNTQIYKNIKKYIPADVKVVMNLGAMCDEKTLMFFNNDLNAYDYILPEFRINEIKDKGLRIAVFPFKDGSALPPYIKNYPNLYIIDKKLE